MPSYSTELDKLLLQRQQEVDRRLYPDETASICIGLVQSWFESARTDELIRALFKEFSRESGLQEISTLARLLTDAQDEQRLKVLFQGLASRRVAAYRAWRSGTRSRGVGSMRSAARALAEAIDILSEYCVWLEKLGLKADYEAVREEMHNLLAGDAEPTAPGRKPARAKQDGI